MTPGSHRIPPGRRAFTLVELVAVMVIISTIAAVVTPLLMTASDAYADASAQREAAERTAQALDRVVRLLREGVGTSPGSGDPDIAVALPGAVEFADGAGLELIGTTLWMTTAGEAASPLCQSVSVFELTYLGEDGVTDTAATPTQTQRVNVRIAAGGVELRTSVLLRAALGASS